MRQGAFFCVSVFAGTLFFCLGIWLWLWPRLDKIFDVASEGDRYLLQDVHVSRYSFSASPRLKRSYVYATFSGKNGKDCWIIQGIGSTLVIGRDRQRYKSRTFTKEHQAAAYLDRHGFRCV